MTDREKVIKGLAACLPETDEDAMIGCEGCPYGCCKAEAVSVPIVLLEDIRALLKAQEPSVMTLEEVKALPDESDVWLEEFCSIVVAVTVSHQTDIYKVLKRYNQNATYFYGIERADYNSGEYMDADYGKEWRCWTSRPTDAQREAIPW